MSGADVTLSRDGIVTGNTYDKYGSSNPLVRRLMASFERDLDGLLGLADPSSLLDVGCGEGVLVERWARRLQGRRVVGIDLEEDSIQAGWVQRQAPNLEYRVQRAEDLPFADGEFALASAIEVLEHVPDPAHTLAEMARCAQRHLLVSVPREPLWRALNMARGAYWRSSATPPGTSTTGPGGRSRPCSRATGRSPRCARPSRGRCCLSASSEKRGARLVGLRPTAPPSSTTTPTSEPEAPPGGPTRSYGSGARLLSVGIAATGLLTFAYFSIASHVLSEEAAQRLDVLWSVMFVVISVIYRPVEQLLSRTIAERRAHGHAEHPLRVPLALQAGFALAFLVVALALHEQLIHEVFDGYTALYYVLLVGTLAYAGSYFARGWLAGHQYFGLFGALVLMESTSRICFALAAALGVTSGQTAVALGIAVAPLLSLVVVPAAFARAGRERGSAREPAETSASMATGTAPIPSDAPELGGAEPAQPVFTADEADAALAGPGTEGVQEVAAHEELSLSRGGRFALWVSGIMLSEQTLLNASVLTVDALSPDRALAGIVFNVMLIARAPCSSSRRSRLRCCHT